MKLISTGPREGKTFKVLGVQFVDGIAEIPGNSSQHGGKLRLLQKRYAVYAANRVPRGLLKNDGISQPQASSERNKNQSVPSEVRPHGEEAASPETTDGGESTQTQAGPAADVPSGDGHEHAGLTEQEQEQSKRISKALNRLDPTDDTHWTSDGSPMVEVVSEISGVNASRKRINSIDENFNRREAARRKAEQ